MSEYAGARSSQNLRDYPQVDVPAKGFYAMALTSFSKPTDETGPCQHCKGTGAVDAAPCPRCNGTKSTTRKVIRLRYVSEDGAAEEDMTFKISDEWVHKGSGRTISASTFYLRCREFTGISDPDLIDAIIQDDRKRESLLGTLCDVTIIPNKTGKYLRIAGVERKGPILLEHATRSGHSRPQPMAEVVEQVRNTIGPAVTKTGLDDVRRAYLATGRTESTFGAFLTVHGVSGTSATARACQDLLESIARLPKVDKPSLSQQMERAGLESDEEVPF